MFKVLISTTAILAVTACCGSPKGFNHDHRYKSHGKTAMTHIENKKWEDNSYHYYDGKEYYNAISGNVHKRSGAGVGNKVLGIAAPGAKGHATECNETESWCHIDFDNGTDGWVSMQYFKPTGAYDGKAYRYTKRHKH